MKEVMELGWHFDASWACTNNYEMQERTLLWLSQARDRCFFKSILDQASNNLGIFDISNEMSIFGNSRSTKSVVRALQHS